MKTPGRMDRTFRIGCVAGLFCLRSRRRRIVGQSAELIDQLGVRVEIGEHDHLADSGILVAAAANCREAALPARATTSAEAKVGFAEIALGHGFLNGRACVHD